MIAEQFISIKQGDATTLTETVTGLVTASGYTAKLYVYDADGTVILTVTGTVSTLTITYQIENEDTKGLTTGAYAYESKLFDTSDHVYSQSDGIFEIRSTNEEDPS
jgi:hypothetical protein